MLKKTHSQDLVSDIENWILNTLSKPNEIFNRLPACPYAKKAWLDGQVVVRYLDDTFEIKRWIRAEIENYTYHWPRKSVEVVVLGFDPTRITPDELGDIIDETKPMLDKRGYTALEDHPDETESVQGFILNQGTYGLVLIQPTAKLEEARAYLEEKDYYKNWTAKYKQDVQQR